MEFAITGMPEDALTHYQTLVNAGIQHFVTEV
jgi:hypothetical protein